MWTVLLAMAAGILLSHVLKWKISCLAVLLYMGEKDNKIRKEVKT